MSPAWRYRAAAIAIGFLIISYGVASSFLLPFYQNFAEQLIPAEYLKALTSFFYGRRYDPNDANNLGKYLIYYPSYLFLHVGLICFLFRRSSKARIIGLALVLFGIPSLALLSMVFYQLKWMSFYDATISTFTTFVGYPFILFVVEGGRLLDKNIDELISDNHQ